MSEINETTASQLDCLALNSADLTYEMLTALTKVASTVGGAALFAAGLSGCCLPTRDYTLSPMALEEVEAGPEPELEPVAGPVVDIPNECDETPFVTIAYNGPAGTQFSPGQNDFSILELTPKAACDTTSKELTFRIDASGDGLINAATGTANITDIRLVDANGTTLMGPLEVDLTGADDSQTFEFTNEWYLEEQVETPIMLSVDIEDNPNLLTPPLAIRGVMKTSESVFIDDTSNTQIPSANIIPSGDIVGMYLSAQ